MLHLLAMDRPFNVGEFNLSVANLDLTAFKLVNDPTWMGMNTRPERCEQYRFCISKVAALEATVRQLQKRVAQEGALSRSARPERIKRSSSCVVGAVSGTTTTLRAPSSPSV